VEEILQEYITKWSLSNLDLIDKTPTSHIYRAKQKNQSCVLKIYTEAGREFESNGPIFLQACKSSKAVVDVIDFDKNACLLDYIDGHELLTLVHDGKDNEATKIIAQTLQKIHTTPIPKNYNFKTTNQQFKALIEHPTDAPDIIHRGKNFLQSLKFNSKEICLLHGDTHHKNIMHQSQKGWIMLDPQGLVGDRAYDCANTLHNPHKMPELTEDKNRLLRQAHILGNGLNINPQRIIDYAYIHGCLSSCWTKMDDGHYDKSALKTSAVLEEFISKE